LSVQVEPPLQLSEQLPVHAMWHVAPPEQSTLPLGPTVMSQTDWPVHWRLHDDPHSPVQSFVFEQFSEQLVSHVPLIVHDCPDGQEHVEPLHVGGTDFDEPHAQVATTTQQAKQIRIDRIEPS
jgi:hypothetical protein